MSANPEYEGTWRDFRDVKDHWIANVGLKSREYTAPILDHIFQRFAEVRLAARRGSRVGEPATYHAGGILYLPAKARFDYLLSPQAGTPDEKCITFPVVKNLHAHPVELSWAGCKRRLGAFVIIFANPNPLPQRTPTPLEDATGRDNESGLPCRSFKKARRVKHSSFIS